MITNFDRVSAFTEKSGKLQKKEAISVYSRWIESFSLNGPIDGLQGRILEAANASGAEAFENFQIKKTETAYLLFDYNRSKMEAFKCEGMDLNRLIDAGFDIAVINEGFNECLVMNHEDGIFWSGPTLIKKSKPNQTLETIRV